MTRGSDQGVFRSRGTGEVFARDSHGHLRRLDPEAAQAWSADERHHRLASELARFGLWDHLPEQQRLAARADADLGFIPLHNDHVDLLEYFADGEYLAEGGVEDFLAELTPGLERHGVSLETTTIESPYRPPGGRDYILAINGRRCTVWLAHEWEQDNPWEAATIRPMAVVNELLAAAGSTIRAHTLYAGTNDGLVLLLDPRAVHAMRESGLFPDHELPAVPEDRPMFDVGYGPRPWAS